MKALGEVGPAKGLTVEGRAVRDIVVVCNKIVLFDATTKESGARGGTDFRKVKFQMKQQKKFNAVSQSVNSTQVNSNLESTFDRLPVIGCAVVYEMTSVTFDSGKNLTSQDPRTGTARVHEWEDFTFASGLLGAGIVGLRDTVADGFEVCDALNARKSKFERTTRST